MLAVLIDDLITAGVDEPYRMFTSRSENRLALRAENADFRLTPLGIEMGIIGEQQKEVFEKKRELFSQSMDFLHNFKMPSNLWAEKGVKQASAVKNHLVFAADILSYPGVDIKETQKIW